MWTFFGTFGPNEESDVDDDRIAFASHESGTEITEQAEERAVQDSQQKTEGRGGKPGATGFGPFVAVDQMITLWEYPNADETHHRQDAV